MNLHAIGIYRETLHSPSRESDDAEILRRTGLELAKEGFRVTMKRPEELADPLWWKQNKPQFAFIMCEKEGVLQQLEAWEKSGITVVNSVQGIWNTYRFRMIDLVRAQKVPFPKSRLVRTTAVPENELSDFYKNGAFEKIWIKRGDVHNTQKDDVFLASSPEQVRQSFENFQTRGVIQAVLQEHIEGDLVKFYGVGKTQEVWHRWFYHKHQNLKKYPFHEPTLRRIFFTAAKALNLEIFGGDAVVTPKGEIFLIDINAWPSFALFRDDASKAIARHLSSTLAVKVA